MPQHHKLLTNNAEETLDLGKRLSSFVFPSLVICLSGDLGAGKTVLTRGLVEGLGGNHVRSPSFTLINEYRTTPPVAHADLYRLKTPEAEDLGLEEYVEKGFILIVEWGERLPELPGSELLSLDISYVESDRLSPEDLHDSECMIREITISAQGERAQELLSLFLAERPHLTERRSF